MKWFILISLILTLSACGSGGGSSSSSQINEVPTNQSPTADAGTDRSVDEQTLVTLDASGSSDTDGSISSYQWQQSTGDAVSLSDINSAAPSFSAPIVTQETSLTFTVTVTDNEGSTSSDTVKIIVLPVNEAPTIEATLNYQIATGTSQLISVTATDTDGEVTSILWTQTSGPDIALSTTDQYQIEFNSPNVSTDTRIIFKVEVTDNEGAVTSKDIVIDVLALVEINVDIATSVPVSFVYSPTFGDISLTSDGKGTAIGAEKSGLVFALDESDEVTLMSISENIKNEGVELSGVTTVESILFWLPSYQTLYQESPNAFRSVLVANEEAKALANFIEMNQGWSKSDSFAVLFEQALNSLSKDLKSSKHIGDIPKYQTPETKAIYLEDLVNGPGYSHTKNYEEVSINLVSTDSYTVSVKNNNKVKWVASTITGLPSVGNFNINQKQGFLVPPNSTVTSSAFLFSLDYPTIEEEIDKYGLYYQGLSMSVGADNQLPTSGRTLGAYYMATGLTLLEFAGQTLKLLVPPANLSCLEQVFFEGSSDFKLNIAKKLGESNEIFSLLNSGEFDEAGFLAGYILVEEMLEAGTSCILDELSTKPFQFLGKQALGIFNQVAAAYGKFNAATTIVEGLEELWVGKSQVFYPIKNTTEQQIIFNDSDVIVANSISAYIEAASFNSNAIELVSKFAGLCSSGTDNGCYGLDTNLEVPIQVPFSIRCTKPDPLPPANDCKEATIKLAQYNPDVDWVPEDFTNVVGTKFFSNSATGEIKGSLAFSNEGEWLGELVTTDTSGGLSQPYYFSYQIRKGQPQVNVGSKNTNDDFTSFEITEDDGSISVEPIESDPTSSIATFSLLNAGYGKAIISSITLAGEAAENVTFLNDSSTTPIEIDYLAEHIIEVDTTGNYGSDLKVIIEGEIGQPGLFGDSKHYSTIKVPIASQVLTYNAIMNGVIVSKHTPSPSCAADNEPIGQRFSEPIELTLDASAQQATLIFDIEGDGQDSTFVGTYIPEGKSIFIEKDFRDGGGWDEFDLTIISQSNGEISVTGTNTAFDESHDNTGTCSVTWEVTIEGELSND